MNRIKVAQAATAAGITVAALQTIWVLMVSLGWATSFTSFVFDLEFVSSPVHLSSFSSVTALCAIAISFCAGAATGGLFAIIANWLTFESAPRWAHDTSRRRSVDETRRPSALEQKF